MMKLKIHEIIKTRIKLMKDHYKAAKAQKIFNR